MREIPMVTTIFFVVFLTIVDSFEMLGFGMNFKKK